MKRAKKQDDEQQGEEDNAGAKRAKLFEQFSFG